MTRRTQTRMQAVVDASVSELLEQWVAEQLERDALPLCQRPCIGVLVAGSILRNGGWPIYGSDAPTAHAILEASGFPCLVSTLPMLEGYDHMQLFCDDHTYALLFDMRCPVVRNLDGLIFTRGGDLFACLYGQQPHPQAEMPGRWRDVWESEGRSVTMSLSPREGLLILPGCYRRILHSSIRQNIPDVPLFELTASPGPLWEFR